LAAKYETCTLPSPPDAPRVYELDPLADARWSEFVKTHPRASVFHSLSWLRALHWTYGYRPVALTTAGPTEPLRNGLVFCQINSWLTGRRLVSLPFSDHCEPLVDTQDDLDALLGQLLQGRGRDSNASEPRLLGRGFRPTAKSKRTNRYVELRPIFAKPSVSTGFSPSATYFLHLLDLSAGPEALFRTFHKDSVQRKIRRAQRESLAYESGNSPDLLEKFYRLTVMTRRRQHNPPQPIAWFQNLSLSFGNALQIRVASTPSGRPVASILTLKHGSTITYKYGCSDAGFNNLGGTALLFWRTIQEAAQEGMVVFDLGRSDVDNAGLVTYKERWGARRSTLEYWQCPERPKAEKGIWKTNLKNRLLEIAPDWCLVAAGRLIYPHIG
jgi:CelD/BcsL family acetyltransferase involved in cellulose biosynthesis